MRKNVLILAHTDLENSTMNKSLIEKLRKEHLDLEIRHVDALYPDSNIDFEAEKDMLKSADLLIFQFPFFWYSAPSSLRKWLELMLERDWAYGNHFALEGKKIAIIVTTGGSEDTYQYNQSNSRNVESYMHGFYEMLRTIKADYLETHYIFGAVPNKDEAELAAEYDKYLHYIQKIIATNS